MITKKELIEMLAEFDDNAIVVMSSDSEGNGYSPVYVVDACRYADGEIDHPEEPWPDGHGLPAICFWPG